MCGICGVVSLTRRRDRYWIVSSPHERHVWPTEVRTTLAQYRGRGRCARDATPRDHRPGGLVRNRSPTRMGRVYVVQNGEIYNYRELSAAASSPRGHASQRRAATPRFWCTSTRSTGPNSSSELRGMFAIALWDASTRSQLVLARDAFGIKPLHYRLEADELSVRIRAESLARRRARSSRRCDAFLAYNVIPEPADDLPRDAEASSRATSQRGRRQRGLRAGAFRSRWRRCSRSTERRRADPATLEEELRARIARLRARPSRWPTSPSACCSRAGSTRRPSVRFAAQESSERIKTFSIGFKEQSFNELENARLVAKRYGTDHHEFVARARRGEAPARIRAHVRRAVRRLGRASDLPCLAARLRTRQGRAFGRGWRRALWRLLHIRRRPARAPPRAGPGAASSRSHAHSLAPPKRVSFDYKAKRFTQWSRPPAARAPPRVEGDLLRRRARAELPGRSDGAPGAGKRWTNGDAAAATDPLDCVRERDTRRPRDVTSSARLQDVDLGVLMVDDLLTRTDRASMAHSLEVRVPFLDPIVSSFAFGLPQRLKVRRLPEETPAPPRRSHRSYRPRSCNGTKRGFSIPAASWLRGELEPFARDVLSPSRPCKRHGYFEPTGGHTRA